jgi:hypothetical protein
MRFSECIRERQLDAASLNTKLNLAVRVSRSHSPRAQIRTGTLQRSLLFSGGPPSGVVPSIGELSAR